MLWRYAPRFDPFEGIFCVTELQAGCVRKPTTDPTSTRLWWSGSQSANVYVWNSMTWNHRRKQNWCDNYLLKMRRFTRSWLTKPTKSSQIKVTLSSRVSETQCKNSSVRIGSVASVLCTPIYNSGHTITCADFESSSRSQVQRFVKQQFELPTTSAFVLKAAMEEKGNSPEQEERRKCAEKVRQDAEGK